MGLQLHQYQLHNRHKLSKVDLGGLVSIVYHNLFGFALTQEELDKWIVGKEVALSYKLEDLNRVKFQNGYYFLEGNKGAILKRDLRKRFSVKKMKIAKKVAEVLERIPTVRMVGVTGSLAMGNANEASDIDLMIITTRGTVWVTRAISYLTLKLLGFNLRKPKDRNEKDKLCFNMWLDERDLKIEKQNIYTAHEIAQIVPLINKEKTYEKFLSVNSWIKDYWPNAIKVKKTKRNLGNGFSLFRIIEPLARELQFIYMKGKITKEIVTATRAFFHPQDWGEYVKQSLAKP